ncbi:MAG: SDR family oxidoreductase [bacterium]|nr:SDR family oxidoreductase [bacterium]
MNLKNKTILVTGSSSGIGQAIAIACAKQGAIVLVHYRNNEKGAQATLKQVKNYAQGSVFQADLSNLAEVKILFAKITKEYPELDCLINNAGEFLSGNLDDYDLWQSEFQNIFFSTLYVTNEFLQTKGSKGLRKIVTISSVYGLLDTGIPGGIQYCAAKAAINSLTVNLAKKLAPHILVNAVAPGYTLTPNWKGVSKKDKQTAANFTKIKRFITPEEIASMVIALLQNDAITGEIIRVDGGLHLSEIF